MKRQSLILSLLSAFSMLPAQASERVALVIGNDAYQHASTLNTAVSDAKAVGESLKKLGFDVLPLMNAGVEDVLDSFITLAERARGAEAVLVYYAGHGIESNGVNYLVPVDAKLEREVQLRTQTVSLDTVLDELKQMQVPARMVILDCCRNNPIEGRSWLASRSSGSGLAALSQDTLAEATLVVYSASPGKPALDRVEEDDTHSPFTSALLEQLPRPGLHSFEMFGRVEDAVIEKTQGRQSPRLFYNGSTQPFRGFHFSPDAIAQTPPAPAPLPAAVVSPMPAVQQTPPAPTPTSAAYPNPVVQMAPPADPAYPNGGRPQLQQPVLPASGYFDLDALYLTGPYVSYNSYSRSQILKQAQAKLKTTGHYASSADGQPGPGTQRAILSYQQAQGLPVTGKLDAATLSSLGLSDQPQISPPKPPAPRPRPQTTPTKPKPTPSGRPGYDAF